jgi:SAM-dependent methyltransferase
LAIGRRHPTTLREVLSPWVSAAALLSLPVGANTADNTLRGAWDTVAGDYAKLLPDLSAEAALDRAVLAAFAELVRDSGNGLVAEVGCGSGRVMAHLSGTGLRTLGLDLSPRMVEVARSLRPDLSFVAADAVALPTVFAEFARVMRVGAPILLAFQSGTGERVDRSNAYGHAVSMTYYRHQLEDVVAALTHSAFALDATVRREPAAEHESTPQALVMAQRR